MKTRTNLTVEALEDRRTPAVSVSRPDGNGVVQVRGDNANDVVTMSQDRNYVYCNNLKIDARSVKAVVVNLGGGHDRADLSRLQTIPTTVYAGTGNDTVFGGQASDRLYGEGNDDHLIGGGGYDYLYGGSGVNFLDDCNPNGHEFYADDAGQQWVGDVVAVNGTTAADVRQGSDGSCGFMATIAGLANTGADMQRYIRYAGYDANGNGLYDVSFWNGRQWLPVRVAFDGHMNKYDSRPAAAQESWVVIMHRAWLVWQRNVAQTEPHKAMAALGIGCRLQRNHVVDADYQNIANALANNRVVVVGTHRAPVSTLEDRHAYTVVGVRDGWVQVRNPWGYDGGGKGADANPTDALIWVRWDWFRDSLNYIAIS